jgi:hypothetical protein
LIICIVFSLISVLAPGNLGRAVEYKSNNREFGFSITMSFNSFLSYSFKWLKNFSVVLFSLLYVPAAARFARSDSKYNEFFSINPIIVFIFSITLLTLLYFPFYYAVGNSFIVPPRYLNVVFIVFLSLIFFNITVIINFLIKIKHKTIAVYPNYILVIIVLCLIYPYKDYNIRRAYNELVSGEARVYNIELNSRYKDINKSRSDTVYVKPLTYYPQTICGSDISEDGNYWTNKLYAEYFKKKCIIIKK